MSNPTHVLFSSRGPTGVVTPPTPTIAAASPVATYAVTGMDSGSICGWFTQSWTPSTQPLRRGYLSISTANGYTKSLIVTFLPGPPPLLHIECYDCSNVSFPGIPVNDDVLQAGVPNFICVTWSSAGLSLNLNRYRKASTPGPNFSGSIVIVSVGYESPNQASAFGGTEETFKVFPGVVLTPAQSNAFYLAGP